MPSRYVILYHRLDEGEHWDLMLELDDVLLTWQLFRDPTVPSNYPIPARRIGDHRKAYLDYEGPLTGNRGTVSRVDSGMVEIQADTPESCRFVLNGARLHGAFLLRQSTHHWNFEASSGT